MSLVQKIKEVSVKAVEEIFKFSISADDILVNQTKPEFEGDYTVVLFALVKQLRQSPEQLGKQMGEYLVENNNDLLTAYNAIKGFLNLSVSDKYFTDFLSTNFSDESIGKSSSINKKIIIEYSSPNTNKPLHLGHLRNNFLGWSVAEILKANGNDVAKTCVVNDRGVHICKSMIAWEMFSNGATPESTHTKGDHFVGDYYVKFSNEHKKETEELVAAGQSKDKAEKNAPIMQKTQQMLVDWEKGKPEVIELWKKMNSWVYKGFDETYRRIGSDFDKTYYESETYLLGKKFVEQGLEQGVFYKKEDGSIWIDLTSEGLDEKLVLRKDGTSVYITQDLGLAEEKYKDFHYDQSAYVIADEQNYHMKVLEIILKKLGKPYADGIFHLSYGMVDLPTGRMKSREGTVVDADDLVDEMVKEAANKTKEKSKVEEFSETELKELYEILALGALKFYLLKVDPKKRMVFNPEESIDFHGFTGPFIQYTYARIKSILRKESVQTEATIGDNLEKLEKQLLLLLNQYSDIVQQAATEYSPAVIANYIYSVAQAYNTFYTVHSVLKAESKEKKQLRLRLCQLTSNVIKHAMSLLGIGVPERM
ncbi:MAG TPA: arginine--tRNA ligase [Flavisolibacter sp.]|jgi:arginyl-tRNA synthetase|nr:arginine--tRNA ligase [Flavisolibacter sp.]